MSNMADQKKASTAGSVLSISYPPKHASLRELFSKDVKSAKNQETNMKTRVVNIYHPNSAKLVTVNVMRPSIWGNPFRIVQSGPLELRQSRKETIDKYREWLKKQTHLLKRLHELKGQVLGCCCKPQPCHADVLAELADLS